MEMVVANALLVEQWYQQLIVSSTRKSGVVSSIRIWCASINCHVCRIQQLVASLEKSAYGKDKVGPLHPISSFELFHGRPNELPL
jgi:hypothetical protein